MTPFDQKLRMLVGNLVVENLAATMQLEAHTAQLEAQAAQIAQLTAELAEARKPPMQSPRRNNAA